jgi:hypothetical protein
MIERVSSFPTKMARGVLEAFFVFDAQKKDGAQAQSLSFPAFDRTRGARAIAPLVFEAASLRAHAASLRRARTRVFYLFQSATTQRANQ